MAPDATRADGARLMLTPPLLATGSIWPGTPNAVQNSTDADESIITTITYLLEMPRRMNRPGKPTLRNSSSITTRRCGNRSAEACTAKALHSPALATAAGLPRVQKRVRCKPN